jgi:sodium-dependent phosphate cotransporter
MVKVMRSATLGRFELLFDRFVGKRHIMALLLGLIVTAIIQSSSVTTSLMVPMAGAGILTIEQIFPVTLGANIGTTVTALLAALATNNIRGLQIAFVHMLFNICGVIIFFVIPGTKRLPIGIAKALGTLFSKKRYFAIIYILTLFFAIPGLLILIHELS